MAPNRNTWLSLCVLSALFFAFLSSVRPLKAQESPIHGADESELIQAGQQLVGKLVIRNPTVDLGEVLQGASVVVRFPYTVEGKGPVTILGLHEDCGCLSTSIKPGQVLPEGTSGEINVTLDTKAFSGQIDKAILIMTNNDRRTRVKNLRIRARIRTMVSLTPPLVRFDFASGAKTPEAFVAVRRLASETLDIEKIEFNKDNLDVEVEPLSDRLQLRIRWKGKVPLQPFQEMIRISAKPPYGDLQIPVLGTVAAKR